MSTLPFRLHQAAQIVSMSDNPEAPDIQSALAVVAARLVMLEETLAEVLADAPSAREKAWELLVRGGWTFRPPRE